MKILADASLPHLESLFDAPFELTYYKNTQLLQDALPYHDVLLCRSTLKITPELLKNTHLKCVATASSGIDHINTDYLETQNITLFDAKGCNADAVADYVLASLAYLHTENKIPASPRVGIMGAGEVGSRVIKRLKALNFDIFAYDPLKPDFNSCHFEALKTCNILCIHANLHDLAPYPTKNSLDANFLAALTPNTVIINAARGGIINEEALLQVQNNIIYCTDVYQNEPEIKRQVIQYATLCTPHIAGHSIEAKYNAVLHISQKLHLHFDLKPPKSNQPIHPTHAVPYQNWVNFTLNQYNPFLETKQLKQAAHAKTAFLTLRTAHQTRHDFSWENYTFV